MTRESPARHILGAYQRAFDFTGRSPRAAFNWFLGWVFVLGIIATAIDYYAQSKGVWFPYDKAFLLLTGFPALALATRRFRDIGQSGIWAITLAVPFVNIGVTVLLAVTKTAQTPRPDPKMPKLAYLGRAMVVGYIFFGLTLQAHIMPSGSMKPTLIPGDYLFADQFAYGLPCLGLCGEVDRLGFRDPQPGQVVVLGDHERNATYIKRIVAGPGDTVQMKEGQLWVNDSPAELKNPVPFVEDFSTQGPFDVWPRCATPPAPGSSCEKTEYTETLANGVSYQILDTLNMRIDNTAIFTVPDQHYFVLGDNRDNSSDSRLARAANGLGMIHAKDIFARPRVVVFSANGPLWDVTQWRGRFMKWVK